MTAQFGATLRLLRTDAGMSLRALAQEVGVSSAYLSRVENGHDAIPTPDRLVEIARVLGLPPALLLELARKVEPFVAGYLERVPPAGALFVEIAKRDLTAPQIARLRLFLDTEFPESAPQGSSTLPKLSSLLRPERVIVRFVGSDLEDVIDVAAGRLAPSGAAQSPGNGDIGAEALAQKIAARERESTTAIGGGMAVPHTVVPDLVPRAALVTLARPLATPTPDGKPLRLVLVLTLDRNARQHLHVLAQAARLAAHGGAEMLAKARDPNEVVRLLREAGF